MVAIDDSISLFIRQYNTKCQRCSSKKFETQLIKHISLSQDCEGSCILSKNMLPPSLFEKIIHKSKEMRWCIDRFYMEELLTFRDVLSWKKVDVALYPTSMY